MAKPGDSLNNRDLVLNHPLLEKGWHHRLYGVLKAAASYKPRWVWIEGVQIYTNEREVATTRPLLAKMIRKDNGLHPSNDEIKKALIRFQKAGFLAQRSAQRRTIITLCEERDIPVPERASGPTVGPTPAQRRPNVPAQPIENADDWAALYVDTFKTDSETEERAYGDRLEQSRAATESETSDPGGSDALPVRQTNGHAVVTKGGASEFDAWWQAWTIAGTKRGKGTARRAYERARRRGVGADTLLDGVRAYMAWCTARGDPPSYIAHPTTWLAGERWEDELPDPDADRAARARRDQPEDPLTTWLNGRHEAARRAVDIGQQNTYRGDVVPLRR